MSLNWWLFLTSSVKWRKARSIIVTHSEVSRLWILKGKFSCRKYISKQEKNFYQWIIFFLHLQNSNGPVRCYTHDRWIGAAIPALCCTVIVERDELKSKDFNVSADQRSNTLNQKWAHRLLKQVPAEWLGSAFRRGLNLRHLVGTGSRAITLLHLQVSGVMVQAFASL